MAYELSNPLIPKPYKVKIRDRERLEEPHVSILKKTDCWRFGLRSRRFMEAGIRWDDFPRKLKQAIEGSLEVLIAEWNRMYPENPV